MTPVNLKKQNKKTVKAVACLLAVLLLAYLFTSSFFVGTALPHECRGEHCIVCLSLSSAKQMYVFLVALISVFLFIAAYHGYCNLSRREYASFQTPLELKVKLTI